MLSTNNYASRDNVISLRRKRKKINTIYIYIPYVYKASHAIFLNSNIRKKREKKKNKKQKTKYTAYMSYNHAILFQINRQYIIMKKITHYISLTTVNNHRHMSVF